MAKILDRMPRGRRSVSDRFLDAFSNSGQDLPQHLSKYYDYKKSLQKESSKKLEDLPGKLSKALKDRRISTFEDERSFGELMRKIQPYIQNGEDFNSAYEKGYSDYFKGQKNEAPADSGNFAKRILGGFAPDILQNLMSKRPREEGEQEGAEQKSDLIRGLGGKMPSAKVFAREAPVAALGVAEKFTVPGTLLELARHKGVGLTPRELLAKEKAAGKETYFEKPSELVAKKLRGDLSPEELSEAKKVQEAEELAIGLFGPKVAKSIASKIRGPKAISPSEILSAERPQITSKATPRYEGPTIEAPESAITSYSDPILPAAEELPPSLQGRITKPPANATEMRVERTAPGRRMFPVQERTALREMQVKNYPKYVEEIERDAAERLARQEDRVPKTAQGKLNLEGRKAVAEARLPAVKDSYYRSMGRVRALEDEVVKLSGQAREHAQSLLDLAKIDLDNAVFEFKQALNNAKFGEKRVGIPEMQTAARNKMIDFENKIADGKEVVLAKRDYSPDLIKQAKSISKKQKLLSSTPDDFYNIVHDTYVQEYKNRLNQISSEIASMPKSVYAMEQIRNLEKEADLLKKMIESAEAEKIIHRHKMGLRQMSETHKANERFKKIQASEKKTASSKVAQEKMWKGRFDQAKTAEERASVINEAVDQMARENPALEKELRAEGERLKEKIENLFSARSPQEPPSAKGEKVSFGGKKPPPPPKSGAAPTGEVPPERPKKGIPTPEELQAARSSKEAGTQAKRGFQNFVRQIKELRDSFPYIWRTPSGRQLIQGAAVSLIDELVKELDIEVPIPISTAGTLIFGHASERISRTTGNLIAKYGIKQWKIGRAKQAYLDHDNKKFSQFPPSIRKKAIERISYSQ